MKAFDCFFLVVIASIMLIMPPICGVAQQVSVQSAIPYCNVQYPGQDKMQKLCFDFYEPENPADTLRPLVITVFGGGFVAGTRDYEDMVEWCNRFAKKGFAAASIDYRLLSARKFSAKNLVRTGYMAAQDVSAAVRFFKANADNYRIDTNRIFLLGQSAGAVAILHAIYMDEDERPSDTFLDPELPPLHSTGNTDAMKQKFSVAGAVLLWGCLFSPDMIDPDETTPICLIHGGKDIVLPPDSGFAFSIPGMPYAYGSQPIANRLKELGTTPFELHILESEPHAFYFKILNMFNIDAMKFDNCFNIAWNFTQRNSTTRNK